MIYNSVNFIGYHLLHIKQDPTFIKTYWVVQEIASNISFICKMCINHEFNQRANKATDRKTIFHNFLEKQTFWLQNIYLAASMREQMCKCVCKVNAWIQNDVYLLIDACLNKGRNF